MTLKVASGKKRCSQPGTNEWRDEKGDSVKYAIIRQRRCEGSDVMEFQNISPKRRQV